MLINLKIIILFYGNNYYIKFNVPNFYPFK